MYISFQDICEMTNRSRSQISFLISKGVLQPVNPNSFRADGGYRFKRADIEAYLEAEKKKKEEWLTLKEAAMYLGRSKTYVLQNVEKGRVSYKEEQQTKRTIRIYNKKELDKIRNELEEEHTKTTSLPVIQDGLILFEKFMHNNEMVRVIDIKRHIGVTSSNRVVHLEGAQPQTSILDKPYCTKPGSVTFSFPFIQQYQNKAMDAILYLIQHAGPRNVQVWKEEDDYKVKVRLVRIPYEDQVMRMLQTCIVKGVVNIEGKEIKFSSNQQRMTISLSKFLYDKLQEAKKKHKFESYSDCIEEALTHYLSDLE